MRKTVFATITVIGMVFIVILACSPKPVSGSDRLSSAGPGSALPDSIKKFVQKSCMDCHAEDGSALARGKVNFSAWENYTPEKQVKKAVDICDEVSKKSMPPGRWQKNNPDRVPTQAEIDMVCHWANSLNK